MRLVLVVALALSLTGIPAVAASPCRAMTGAESSCCHGHQETAGAKAIGYCGCTVAPSDQAEREVVSVAAAPHDRTDSMALVALPTTALAALTAIPATRPATALILIGSGPPRLTGAGFRC